MSLNLASLSTLVFLSELPNPSECVSSSVNGKTTPVW